MFRFLKYDYLTDGKIDLWLLKKARAVKRKGYLPAYIYEITLHEENTPIGRIDVRIGSNKNTYYGGNIGYRVFEDYRGNAYAAKACKIISQVAKAHGMDSVIITCNPDNIPSKKTCENIGAKLLEIVDLPKDNEMYKLGERKKCRYEWIIDTNNRKPGTCRAEK